MVREEAPLNLTYNSLNRWITSSIARAWHFGFFIQNFERSNFIQPKELPAGRVAISVYVLVAIIKKQLRLDVSLHSRPS